MGSPKTRAEVENTIWRKPVEGDAVWHILTWDVGALTVPVARMRELVASAELPLSLPDIQESTALLRALRELAEDRLIAEVYNDKDETAWALVRVQRSDDKDDKRATLSQELTVSYIKSAARKNGETVVYSSEAAREKIEPLLNRYRDAYTQRDVTTHILSYCIRMAGGLKMRDQGGMYCVGPEGGLTVERLHTLVDLLNAETGGSAHLTDIEAADSGRTKNDMRYHGHKALAAELRSMRAKLKDMLRADRTDDQGRSKVKPETAAGYLRDCDELGQRAALWRDMAELGLAELNDGLRELRGAFDAVRQGVVLGDFTSLYDRVDAAVTRAETATPHAASTPDDDPFAPEPLTGPVQPTLSEAAAADAVEEPASTAAQAPAKAAKGTGKARKAAKGNEFTQARDAVLATFGPQATVVGGENDGAEVAVVVQNGGLHIPASTPAVDDDPFAESDED